MSAGVGEDEPLRQNLGKSGSSGLAGEAEKTRYTAHSRAVGLGCGAEGMVAASGRDAQRPRGVLSLMG